MFPPGVPDYLVKALAQGVRREHDAGPEIPGRALRMLSIRTPMTGEQVEAAIKEAAALKTCSPSLPSFGRRDWQKK